MRMVQLTKQEKENILENLLKRSPNQYDEYQEAVKMCIRDRATSGINHCVGAKETHIIFMHLICNYICASAIFILSCIFALAPLTVLSLIHI